MSNIKGSISTNYSYLKFKLDPASHVQSTVTKTKTRTAFSGNLEVPTYLLKAYCGTVSRQ